ncbi:MAG TPA: hypothetical protein VHZ78_02670 [Rhizomicrobium sp.]|jgi:hypothetical protein|nr:hypothetical protein [Rhizomicrobium sp.]
MIWGKLWNKKAPAVDFPKAFDADGNVLGMIVGVTLLKCANGYAGIPENNPAFEVPAGTDGTVVHISSSDEVIVEVRSEQSPVGTLLAYVKPSDVRLDPWYLEENKSNHA